MVSNIDVTKRILNTIGKTIKFVYLTPTSMRQYYEKYPSNDPFTPWDMLPIGLMTSTTTSMLNLAFLKNYKEGCYESYIPFVFFHS